jgi:hypothetical protein
MSKQIVFTDDDGNTITSYKNTQDKAFICINQNIADDHYMQYICLDKADLLDFIKELKIVAKEL